MRIAGLRVPGIVPIVLPCIIAGCTRFIPGKTSNFNASYNANSYSRNKGGTRGCGNNREVFSVGENRVSGCIVRTGCIKIMHGE
jgi:hypothetical protein